MKFQGLSANASSRKITPLKAIRHAAVRFWSCYGRNMSSPAPSPPQKRPTEADQRLVMYNVPWSGYEAQLALRGDAPVPRLAYLDGAMELMSPSREHERLKSGIGRLIEAFAIERGIELSPYGAWTLRAAPKASGLEPDECYIIGSNQAKERPDLAIEVIWTSGGIDQLEIYRRLGVPEVWTWRDGTITISVLCERGYTPSEESKQLPGIDLQRLLSFLDYPTVTQAVRAYRDTLTRG